MTGREMIEVILRNKNIDKEILIEDSFGNEIGKILTAFGADDGIVIQIKGK